MPSAPGARTVAAVRAFQRDHGQAPTGEIGPATLAALRAAWHARGRAPAVAEAGGNPATAPDLQPAKAFLTRLYAPYIASSRGNSTYVEWTRWAEPSLVSLLKRSGEPTPRDEMPSMAGDPICVCEELDARTSAITTRAGADGEALGTASFVDGGQQQSEQLRLVRTRDAWRIADITDANTPSLRQYLQADIAKRTASRARRPGHAHLSGQHPRRAGHE